MPRNATRARAGIRKATQGPACIRQSAQDHTWPGKPAKGSENIRNRTQDHARIERPRNDTQDRERPRKAPQGHARVRKTAQFHASPRKVSTDAKWRHTRIQIAEITRFARITFTRDTTTDSGGQRKTKVEESNYC